MENLEKTKSIQSHLTQNMAILILLTLVPLSGFVVSCSDGSMQTEWALSEEQEIRAKELMGSDPDFSDWLEIDSRTKTVDAKKEALIETYEFLAQMNRKWRVVKPDQLQMRIDKIQKDGHGSEDRMFESTRKQFDIVRQRFWDKIAYTILFRKAEPLACDMSQIESLTESTVPLSAKDVVDDYLNLDWTEHSFYERFGKMLDGEERAKEGFGFTATADAKGQVFKIRFSLAKADINILQYVELDDKAKEDLTVSTINRLCSNPPPHCKKTLTGLFPDEAQSLLDALGELAQADAASLKTRRADSSNQEAFLDLLDISNLPMIDIETHKLKGTILCGKSLSINLEKKATSDIREDYRFLMREAEE